MFSLSGSHFYQFHDNFDLEIHKNSPKINKKSSENSLGTPLGMKTVILVNLQYLSHKNHVFQDSRDQKINKRIINLSKNQPANLSNRKDLLFIKKNIMTKSDPEMNPK